MFLLYVLGKKILESVSKEAWQQWLDYQTMLINENNLNLFEESSQSYLKKQMEISSSSKFSIIFAPEEFAEGHVVLRNMIDRTEKQISLDELITDPKSVLNL